MTNAVQHLVKSTERPALPSRARDARGSALVEFAATLPILVMLFFAIARFGIAFNNYLVLTDAVRIGARALAVGRGLTNPCSTAGTKTQSAASALTSASLTMTTTVNGTAYTAAAGSAPTCSGQGTSMVIGADAIMTATYPCSIAFYGVNFVPGCTLTSSTTVRVE